MANCIKCGRLCEEEILFYVMEWSDGVSGGRQAQQAAIRGAVKAGVCLTCLAAYTEGRTKGLGFSKKEKERAKDAISSGDYSGFLAAAAADAIRAKVDGPNAGKSKLYAAWATANAADHLLNETFIPAEYVVASLVQDETGNMGIVAHEPIKYILTRPSVFKLITYNVDHDQFEFAVNEQWIDSKWLTASENTLRACKVYAGA